MHNAYSMTYKNQIDGDVEKHEEFLDCIMEDMRLERELHYIHKYIKGPDVLDFPVGTGRITERLCEEYKMSGFDIGPLYVQKAKEKFARKGGAFEEHSFENCNSDLRFDTIICLRTLQSIDAVETAFQTFARLLKPGGRVIFNLPPNNPHTVHIEEMMGKAGLKKVACESYDFYAAWRYKLLPAWGMKLFQYYRAIVERGFVPHVLLLAIELAFQRLGTRLYCYEKVT